MDDNITAQLKDIKPLLEIPDNSYYIYWGLIGLGVFLLFLLVLFVVLKLWKKRKINLAKDYLETLKTIEWKESKKSAYKATHYARLLVKNETMQEAFDSLEPLLEQYKYKKEVGDADAKTKEALKHFIEVADESI